jgi:hypothetical protein
MRSPLLRVVVLGVASLVLAACGGGGDGDHQQSPTPASITMISGDGQSGTVATELPLALTVHVADAGTRPVAGVTVNWAVTAGGGTLTPATSTTDAAGNASTRWTLGPASGSNQATATVTGLPAVTFTATATAGATASVTVTSPVETADEGDTVQFTAVARDAEGNAVPGKTFTWASSEPAWAPVSNAGLLNAWGVGEVTVTATVDGFSGTAVLSIRPILATVAVGAKDVVFDWTEHRCEDLDVPDGPTRVVRAGNAELVLFSGNAPRYYVSRGSTFDTLQRQCSSPALTSLDDRTPQSYQNWEWLWSVHRDGSTWHALIHNEFHDTVAPLCRPGDPSPANPCWYNSITYAVSTDDGRTFTKPLAPAHVVAPAPNRWTAPTPETPRDSWYYWEGYRAPTNLVRAPDGYYYSMMDLRPAKEVFDYRICAMRTRTLADPSSWRAWDGSGFNLPMRSPYVTGEPATPCTALHWPIGNSSIAYSTYLERFILVNETSYPVGGQAVCGVFYMLSADFVHWSEPQLIAEAKPAWCPVDPLKPGLLEPVPIMYPAIVDHGDTTVNFEHVGRTPHLYYTRFNDGGLDRDLVRVQLTFTRTN